MSTAEATDIVAKCKRFAELTNAKRDLEAKLRPIQDELTAMEDAMAEDMALAGMQSINVDGMTVYRQREFYARLKEGVEREQMVQAFGGAGLVHLLGLSWQTLRALAKEWSEEGQEMPPVVAQFCEVGEATKVRCRKAS